MGICCPSPEWPSKMPMPVVFIGLQSYLQGFAHVELPADVFFYRGDENFRLVYTESCRLWQFPVMLNPKV